MNIELLAEVASMRPDWHFVMLGPVVKIDPEMLPKTANIRWLGGKSYEELPQYMSNWDAAMMPFALNDSTRFISPTKTPEYLAAGLPVVVDIDSRRGPPVRGKGAGADRRYR
jgi:UDP-galactopyranose mutase